MRQASNWRGTVKDAADRLLTGEIGMRIFDADGEGPYSEQDFDAVFTEPMWNFVAH